MEDAAHGKAEVETRMKSLLALVTACTLCAGAQSVANPAITTKSYDDARTSANTAETTLTPAAVRARGMRKLPSIPVVGDARGMEAQPLVANDLMYLPSMANVIRAVNAGDGSGVWQTPQLCAPVNWDPPITNQGAANRGSRNDMWHVNDHFGMLSTGVIDTDTGKLYQVATCSNDGSGSFESTTQRMFVLDIRTGAVLANVLLTGSSNGMNFQDAPRKQRAALLLWQQNGTKFVIVLAGSFSENGPDASGWLLAFDTFDNQFKASLSTKAGGWMSGEGPAEDPATGLIYLGLGNGPFDGVTKFGEAALQVQFTPPAGVNAAALKVLHAWAPFSDDARTCRQVYTANKTAGLSAPGATPANGGGAMPRSDAPGANMPMAANCSAAWGDQDAHLTGTLLLAQHLYITAGKDGITYVLPTTAFPGTRPGDFAKAKKNCAKVAMYEAGWDLGSDPCPATAPFLNVFPGGRTRHQHSPIVQAVVDGVTYLLFFAENSPLQVWRVNANGTLTYIARGADSASPNAPSNPANNQFGGMPGGFGSVSSNGGSNAIAWYSIPLGDANKTVTTGFLAAYDLSGLAALEGTADPIPTLWKSAPYIYNKFAQPVVWNGQVYLPNYGGSVDLYALGQ